MRTTKARSSLSQSITGPWRSISGPQRRGVAALVIVLIVLDTAMVWWTGGTQFAYLHLLYVPVVAGGLALGLPGGVAAGLAAGLAVGPLMPLDVTEGVAQPPLGWLLRTLAFVMVGALVGAGQGLLHARLRDTERLLHVEQRLRRSQRQRHDLAQQVLEDGARERNRLALHVHNEVVGHLVAARHRQESGAAYLARGDTDRAETLFAEAVCTLDSGIAECRQLLDRLRCSILEPGTLGEAIGATLDGIAHEHGLCTRLDLPDGGLTDLSLPVELLLYETAQTALGNVTRHANATTVTVRLRADDRHVSCTIVDDGEGFDPTRVPSGHGLDLLAQRWSLAGGHLKIDSAPGQGASVRARMPLGIPPAL